jgi:hypothetical protein
LRIGLSGEQNALADVFLRMAVSIFLQLPGKTLLSGGVHFQIRCLPIKDVKIVKREDYFRSETNMMRQYLEIYYLCNKTHLRPFSF